VENCRSISQQQQQLQPVIVFDDYNLIPVHDLQHSSVEEAVGSSQLVESRRRLQLLQPQLYYRFRYTRLAERCSILHAQLRNLLCSSSKHDIFYATQSHIIRQWNPITRQGRQLIDFSRLPGSSPTVFRVSALCARYDVLVVAGYFGEVACKLLETAAEEPPQFSIASCADNSLINYADICYTRSGSKQRTRNFL
jgi:hypothetical protein